MQTEYQKYLARGQNVVLGKIFTYVVDKHNCRSAVYELEEDLNAPQTGSEIHNTETTDQTIINQALAIFASNF